MPSPAPKRSGNDQPKQGEDGDHRERHERLPSVQSKMLARAHDALLAYGPQSQPGHKANRATKPTGPQSQPGHKANGLLLL